MNYAIRSIRRAPFMSVVVIAVLSVTVAVVTVLFSIVNGVFLHPLPYPEPATVVSLHPLRSLRAAVDELHKASNQFESVATFSEGELTLEIDHERFPLVGARIDSMFYPVLRTTPLIGRLPQKEELHVDDPVALIGEALWVSRFGKRSDIVGTGVRVEGKFRRIIGVMPRWFTFPGMAEIWIPFGTNERSALDYVFAVGRLKPGGTLELVQEESRVVIGRLKALDSARFRRALSLGSLRPEGEMIRRGRRFGGTSALTVILAGAACVLIIASTNLAGLMLGRGLRRRGEILIRASLGASRWQLVRQQFLEGLILGGLSATFGVIIATWGVRLPRVVDSAPAWAYLGLDWRVLLFALAISVFAILVFSLWPAIEAARVELAGALRSGTERAMSHRDAVRSLHLPIVLQVSLSAILLVASTLLARSAYEYARGETLFFRNLYSAGLVSHRPADTSRTEYTRFRVELGKEARRRLGSSRVASLARYSGLSDEPPASDYDLKVVADNRYLGDALAYPGLPVISDNYFEVLGIPILRGRTFTDADPAGTPTVVVVSKRFAQEVWGSINVLGNALLLGKHRVQVIGVSENVRRIGVVDGNVALEEGRDVFLSERQVLSCCGRWSLIVRSERGAPQVESDISTAAAALGLSTAVVTRSLADLNEGLQSNIQMATVLGVFAFFAMLLAGVGIYGIVSFTVLHRVREAGIRLALGAQKRDIVREMMGSGMRLVAIGVLVGLGGSMAVARLLANFIINTPGASVTAAVAAAALFIGLGALACYIPARKSGDSDPAMLLRE